MSFRARLLLATIGLVVVTVLALTVAADRWLRPNLEQMLAHELEVETRLVAAGLPRRPAALSREAHRLGALLGRRVTLIDSTGVVLGDSEFDEAALRLLENHLTRPEVQEALAHGVGSSLRHSASTDRDEMKVAIRAWPGFVRLSAPLTQVDAAVGGAQRALLFAALFAFVVGSLLAVGAGSALVKPLQQVAAAARQAAHGGAPIYPASNAPEIRQLVLAFRAMQEETERRMRDLEQRRAESETLIASMAQGVIAADPRGAIQLSNPAARRLLGYDRETSLPNIKTLFRQRAARDTVERVYRGESIAGQEMELEGRTIVISGRPLPDGGAVLALLDVTDLRRLQAVRRDFVANVSHELKTPLTNIFGYAETLLTEAADPEMQRRFLGIIRDNAERMRRLVDDLLDLAKLESGGWMPRREPLDLAELGAEAWQVVDKKARTKAVTLTTDLDPSLTLHADREALREILVNLFDNAIRHSDQGGVVTLSTSSQGNSVEVTVRDTGVGIPTEHVPRVFERFYRVDPGRSRAEGGTGLGLSIVRHLVEAHGGEAELESTVRQGTTVRLRFPSM